MRNFTFRSLVIVF